MENDIKIGRLVQANIKQIFHYCETVNHNEFEKLCDLNYSKTTFGISYKFCSEVVDIPKKDLVRYWTDCYIVRGKTVRVCSQWFEKNKSSFLDYLIKRNIETVLTANVVPARKIIGKNSRYRSNAIGNAQNLFVRNILSNLGFEAFNENDWIETKNYFQNRCAYCGKEAALILEHAIPINQEKLGEHRLGNLVPSCDSCNKKKGSKDFREFLSMDDIRIGTIEQYMNSRNYVPLGDNQQIKNIIDMAYKEVSSLADRYKTIINQLLSETGDKD